MSLIPIGFGGDTGGPAPAYEIENSLRFRASATAYLERTPSTGSGGNVWTWSGWLKRGLFTGSTEQIIFNAGFYVSSVNRDVAGISIFQEQLRVFHIVNSTMQSEMYTTALLRDPSAHYHIFVRRNAATYQIYINGVLQPVTGVVGPAATNDLFGASGRVHRIGFSIPGLSPYPLDGYLSEINFIDGQALTPDSFGEINPDTGVWVPKAYSGSYGTNGFYLKFDDGSNLTELCRDRSGNTNDWTATNVSLTAGVTYDWMDDTPTNNFAVLNPLDAVQHTTSQANLFVTRGTATDPRYIRGSLFVSSGKWYWETFHGASASLEWTGIGSATASSTGGGFPTAESVLYATNGQRYVNGVNSAYGATWAVNTDLIGVALDLDANQVTFYKNNVSQGAISIPSGQRWTLFTLLNGNAPATMWANFGQRPFVYGPPPSLAPYYAENFSSNLTWPDNEFTPILTVNGAAAGTADTRYARIYNSETEEMDVLYTHINSGGAYLRDPHLGIGGPAFHVAFSPTLSTASTLRVRQKTQAGVALYSDATVAFGVTDAGNNDLWYVWCASWGSEFWSPSDYISGPATSPGQEIIVLIENGTLTVTFDGTPALTATVPDTGAFGVSWARFEGWGASSATGGVPNSGQLGIEYIYIDTLSGPSAFKPLCTKNLPVPVIQDPRQHFDVNLWSGNGTTQTITNAGFRPDLVWIKSRSAVNNHLLTDSVRGNTAILRASTTDEEGTTTQGITSFNSNGFSLGNEVGMNNTPNTLVGWSWRANGAAVTNTAGTITSQVSANTTAGFSIVTYTGNLSASGAATVGHGLGVAPKMVISKSRNVTGLDSGHWCVQHSSLSANNVLFLTLTSAQSAVAGGLAAPTSSVFNAQYQTGLNVIGNTFVAYCFAEVPGFSHIGSYTGNGVADGPFVYCGFRPAFVLVKRSNGTSNWFMLDAARPGRNPTPNPLYTDSPIAEGTFANSSSFDLLSNGFKVRVSAGDNPNVNGGTYIFIAFAESPFNYSRAR